MGYFNYEIIIYTPRIDKLSLLFQRIHFTSQGISFNNRKICSDVQNYFVQLPKKYKSDKNIFTLTLKYDLIM